ncbi:MAG: MarR family transcriptional regulator [Jatrophihabitans endophyticus]|nr:MarR family transcriptional regulator [Jatrophihabitans endophyticus]
MRTFNRARSRMLEATAHDVEWAAHVVLKCLQTEGPMRAGALAECVMSDPSTVSRQVASLVKDGLLERRADPDDGRASLLVLTPRAHEVLARHDRIRLRFFAEMLSAWNPAELHQFAQLLGRFADDFSHTNHDWVRSQLATDTPQKGTD